MQTGILAMTAALTISCSGAAMALQPREVLPEAGGEGQAVSEAVTGNASADEASAAESLSAADRILESLAYGNGGAAFRIPADGILPEALTIQISGRAVYEDGFSTSLHYLEEENGAWKTDTVYFVPLHPACTELVMTVIYTDQNGETTEKSADLLAGAEEAGTAGA